MTPVSRETLRYRGQNFKHLGPLTPEQEAWFHSYGLSLHRFHQDWDGKKREADT